VAICRAEAEDLNAWIVRHGHATVYRRYAEDYANAELTAKALRQGIWAGAFQQPSEWTPRNTPSLRDGVMIA
jgi:endonuclease YncB( thermonuclease family)